MTLHYPVTTTPEAGSYTEVEQGIYWLRLPLPFELSHINVWLLDEGDAWTLVDAGVSLPPTKQAWEGLYASELGSKPVKRLIVTHHHPDHFGLARWHCDRFGIGLYGSAPAINRATRLLRHADEFNVEAAEAFFRANGAADPARITHFISGSTYRRIVSGLPDRIQIIEPGSEIKIGKRRWRTIISHGHAEGHLSLYCAEAGILIAGDQVLPTITSNISLFEDVPDLDPLQQYLDSMADFRGLPEDTLVLPSHGEIFRGLHDRIAQIETAHMERSAKVYGLCDEPISVSGVAARLFPKQLDEINTCLAFGETFSHLRYLERRQRLHKVDRNGLYLYQA